MFANSQPAARSLCLEISFDCLVAHIGANFLLSILKRCRAGLGKEGSQAHHFKSQSKYLSVAIRDGRSEDFCVWHLNENIPT